MSNDNFRFAVLAEKVGYDKLLFLHNLSLTQLYEDIVIPFEENKPERVNRNETARCSIYCRFSSVVGSGAFGGLIQTAVG
jgi:hypothetical protein